MSERALMNVMGRVSKVFPHRVTRKKKQSGIAIPMLKTTQRKTEPLVPAIREALSSVRIVYGEKVNVLFDTPRHAKPPPSKDGRGHNAHDRM
jgi:hypothetical protein